MQVYYETEPAQLSDEKIYFIKSITENPSVVRRMHWHNSYEILYVRRGSGEQRINSKVFDFSPGSATVICPGDIHTTVATSSEGYEIDVLQFVGEYFDRRQKILFELKSTVLNGKNEEICELFDKIRKHVSEGDTRENLFLAGAVFMLCGILSERCKTTEMVAKKTKFAQEVCQYLSAATDMSLSKVSQTFGYSSEHFSRKFHAETGISYKHYCERIKMHRFFTSLDSEDLTLGEVADKLGYSDASSFVRAFKRMYGSSPGAYRRLKNR